MTAITIYITDSLSERFFISVRTADMPLIKHCFPVTALISSMAAIVPSPEVASSKNTTIKVEFSELKKSYKFSGRTSLGRDISAIVSYHTTSAT